MMTSLARTLMIVGVILLLMGAGLYLAARSGIQLGKLPGDIRIQSGNFTCLIGLGTSILLSILLTIILNIIIRLFHK